MAIPYQFQYYGPDSGRGLTKQELYDFLLERINKNTSYLKFQILPSAKFYFNNSTEPITISGIYELKLIEGYEINKLQVDINSLNAIDNFENGFLLIDFINN